THRGKDLTSVYTREYVATHEQAPNDVHGSHRHRRKGILRIVEIADPRPLQNKQAVISQKLMHLLVVGREVLDPDVLHHLQRHDFVEGSVHIAVVANLDLGTI